MENKPNQIRSARRSRLSCRSPLLQLNLITSLATKLAAVALLGLALGAEYGFSLISRNKAAIHGHANSSHTNPSYPGVSGHTFNTIWIDNLLAKPVAAQIIPDRTLPNNSQVVTEANILTITGGTEAQGNLFHSFQEFSIRTGETAFFNQSEAIANIISRVTGANLSNIDGQIRTNGSANLFLLNPNGILFGNNASLDIGGSFLASTATGLEFADGSLFSTASDIAATSLLTMSVPAGLQFGNNPGSIALQSQPPIRSELRVRSGQTLALVGGNLTIAGSVLTAPTGRIELGSVVTTGTVQLNSLASGWELDYSKIAADGLGDLNLNDRAFVTTDGNGGGNIQIQGRNITLSDGSRISANTFGDLPGGNLLIQASETIELVGESADGEFITLLTSSVLPDAIGNGGNIEVIGDRLILKDGAQILNSTFGLGNAGNTNIQARSIELTGIRADGSTVSGFFASAEQGSTGQGGNLTISAAELIAQNGAQIVASTFSSGNAGDLTVQASQIELSGTNPLSATSVSGIKASTNTNSTGNGGNLLIETDRLSVKDGAEVQVSTLGTGNAGSLVVNATDSIELVGISANGLFPSALRAVSGLEGSFTGATGAGGDLTVSTDRLDIRDRANISVSAIGPTGGAGNLIIQANSVMIDNQSGLEAETRAGDRGNINLTLGNTLQLRRNSSISTNAIGTATGGNITIATPTLAALENSDITANSVSNFGGLVNISAQGIFGTTNRDSQTAASDITASSELGAQFSGVVEINTPDVDPAQGLVSLPVSFAAENQLVASACAIDRNISSAKLLISGRGGLPIVPGAARSGIDIIEDLGDNTVDLTKQQDQDHQSADRSFNLTELALKPASPSIAAIASPPSSPSINLAAPPQTLPLRQTTQIASQIIEAQGWLQNGNQPVMLVSHRTAKSMDQAQAAQNAAIAANLDYFDRLEPQLISRPFSDRHHCYPQP
jgi:filamentous hemagglutinin family protein